MGLKKGGDKKLVHVELEEDDFNEFKKRAKEQERSASALARIVIKKYLQNKSGNEI